MQKFARTHHLLQETHAGGAALRAAPPGMGACSTYCVFASFLHDFWDNCLSQLIRKNKVCCEAACRHTTLT